MRARKRTIAGLAGLALTFAACGPRAPESVLLVTLDTTRADRIGAFGGQAGVTPVLDALAAESAAFLNAACQVPITTPSHATILTGLLPTQHGVRDNGAFVLPDAARTLAERLAERGFATHAVVSSFALDRRFGLGQGFAGYDDQIAAGGAVNPRAERRATESVDRALAWLATTRGPWMLWLHLYDPHDPYDPPPPWAERFRDRPYEGELAYMDHELGRLLAALRATGRLDDTLVVVVGDHGEGLGDHGERLHGTLLYDSTVRVPLLVRWPGGKPRAAVTDSVGTHDIVPTVLAALGLPADPGLAGADLRPPARGEGRPGRAVYSESLTPELHYGWSRLTALRTERFKLLRGVGTRLHDHQKDPGETRDVAATEPALVQALERELDALERDPGTAAPGALDPESAEKLAALGYVSPGGSSAGARAIDPAANMDLEGLLLDALELEPTQPLAAMERYRQALARDPELKLALLRLIELEERSGDLAAALDRAGRLLARYPDVEPAWSATLRMLTRSGRWAEARAAAERAVAALPLSDSLRVDLAAVCRVQGDLAAADTAARAVASGSLERPRAAWVLATVAAARNQRDETLRLLAEAIRGGEPRDPAALVREPALASMRGDPEFERLLRLAAERPPRR